jgi:hypothetical protein
MRKANICTAWDPNYAPSSPGVPCTPYKHPQQRLAPTPQTSRMPSPQSLPGHAPGHTSPWSQVCAAKKCSILHMYLVPMPPFFLPRDLAHDRHGPAAGLSSNIVTRV